MVIARGRWHHGPMPSRSGSAARLLASLLFGAALLPVAAAPLEIGVPNDSDQAGIALAVLRRAYAMAGLELRPRELPLRRSLQMAIAGELDGELMRMPVVLDSADNLIRVGVPIVQLSYSAYMKGKTCPQRITLEELAERRVSYIRGIRAIESVLPPARLIAATNYAESFKQLEHDIVDRALGVELETDLALLRQQVRGICKIAEPIAHIELYHALHRRHAALVPRIEQALGALQRSGEMAKIWAAEERRLREAAKRDRGGR